MKELWNQDWDGGGYGRYHYSSEADSAGPWPVASLIVARAWAASGETGEAMKVLDWLSTIPGAKSGSWFEFYGDRISPPYPQIGILPWTWAEMLQLMIYQMLGVKVLEDAILIAPRLPEHINQLECKLKIRNQLVKFKVISMDQELEIEFEDKKQIVHSDGILIPFGWPSDDYE
jgi:hypothetical protein